MPSMKTKYERPLLAQISLVCGWLSFIAAPLVLIGGRGDFALALAIAFGVAGVVCLGLDDAIHFSLDFLARSTEANEAMLVLMEEQNRMLAARENAPPVKPPVMMSPTTIALTTPPVKQAADELKSTCRHCSTRISFPREYDGQEAACPTCGNAVLLAAN